jgi:predicted ATPase
MYDDSRGVAADVALAVTDRIVTGRRLIGRESRLSRLRSAIERTREERRPRLVCVTGVTGVGKSALLNGFVAQPADNVVVGAAAAVPDTGPYAALGAALDGLARQVAQHLAAGPKERSRTVLSHVIAAVGGGADLLVDLAPRWRSVIGGTAAGPAGEDAPAEHAGPNSEHVRNRLQLTVQRLVAALSEHLGCVVFVIDNLQHADRHSIDAFSVLLAADDSTFVLVGAYPTKEVGPSHPLRGLLDSGSRRAAAVLVTIELRPLPDTAVVELVADTLGLPHADVQGLATVVVQGTRSNPLAVEQLLHWLAEQGLLTFDRARGGWTWQMDRVSAIAPAAVRIDAMVQSRLNRLSPALRELLRIAALLGDRFRLDDLVRAVGEQSAGLNERLRLAVQLEMLRLVDTSPAVYEWAHGLVRETVLDNVSAGERAAVAAALLTTVDDRGADRLFELLARADAAEIRPLRLAELHLAAARVATRRGATEVAHRHLRAGVEALPVAAWQRRYALAFNLHVEAARAARALGDSRAADRMLDLALAHARDNVDRAAVARARLVLRWHRRGFGGDPQPGLAALHLLGVELPDAEGDWAEAANRAVATVHPRLSELDIARKPALDKRVRFTADLIAELLGAVYTDADISAVLAARGVELALEHGFGPGSGYALAWLGVAVAARLGDEESARRCAETALALADDGRVDDPHAAATKTTVALALPFLVGPPQSTLALLSEAHEVALDQGDLAAAMTSLLMRPYYLLAIGAPIDEVAHEVEASIRLAGERGRFPLGEVITGAVADAVAQLQGAVRVDLPSPPLAEQSLRGELGYVSGLHLTGALMTAYLLGDYEHAVELAEAAEKVPVPSWAGLLESERRFYHALALAARYPQADPRTRRKWRSKIATLRHELSRWAAHRPAGFAHKALLVSAEQARLDGDIETAFGRYERVIGGARESGFLHVQAIAAELGGRCALEHGTAVDALAYLRRARACYGRWGAAAKVDQLAGLLDEAPAPVRPAHPVDQLDLLNVVKAFQTISAVLDFDKLTATLLELLVHHSGAQRGCLVLREDGALRLAAEAVNDSDLVEVTRAPSAALESLVPVSLVEHTIATREVHLLRDDALGDDPYLLEHRPRAFLAAPIAHQDRLIGVLYLEHRLRADAFGVGQLDSLEVLCTQAAISLDNAAVYAKLAEANRILDATFERLPVGLIVLRPDLTVHRASPHAVRLLGLPIRTGTPLVDLIDVLTPVDEVGEPFRLEPALAAIGSADFDGSSEPRDVVIVQPDGARQRLRTWFMALRDSTGRLLGVTLLVQPVSF